MPLGVKFGLLGEAFLLIVCFNTSSTVIHTSLVVLVVMSSGAERRRIKDKERKRVSRFFETSSETDSRRSKDRHRKRLKASRAISKDPKYNSRKRRYAKFNVFEMTEEELEDRYALLKSEMQSPGGTGFFLDFAKDLNKSVLLYYLNSDVYRFGEHREFDGNWQGCDIDIDALVEDIKTEALTDKERARLVEEFQDCHPMLDGELVACAVCGVRGTGNDGYFVDRIDNPVFDVLRYSEQETILHAQRSQCSVKVPLDNVGLCDFSDVRPFDVVSVVDYNGQLYHLHKEGFAKDDEVMYCSCCRKFLQKKEKPKLSVANGVDFGSYHRIGLTTPNIHETLIITKYRMYTASLKIRKTASKTMGLDVRTSMKGHVVFYLQDIESWVNGFLSDAALLTSERFKDTMKIMLLDSNRKPDILMKKMLTTAELLARPWVLYQWFCVLKHTHAQFGSVTIPSYADLVTMVEEANSTIVENMDLVSDKEQLSREDEIGSDITRTRDSGAFHSDVGELEGTDDISCFSSAGSSFLMNTPESVVTKQMFTDEHMLHSGVSGLGLSGSGANNAGGAGISNDDPEETVEFGVEDHNTSDSQVFENFEEFDDGDPETEDGLGLATGEGNQDDFDRWMCSLREHNESMDRQSKNRESKGIPRRNNELAGEIGTGDRLPSAAFPFVFMLNKVYGRGFGSTSREQLNHLFSQHTLIASQCRLLQGYMCDVMQRFQVMKGVNVHVKKNVESVKFVQRMMDNPEELRKITEVIRNDRRDKKLLREATKMANQLMGHLFFGGRMLSYAAMDCKNLTAMLMEAAKRFSCPSCFYTACIEDVNNPRSFRSSFHTIDNSKFPACFGTDMEADDFLEKIKLCCEPERFGVGLDSKMYEYFGYEARLRRAQSDPISYVREGRDLIYDVMFYLFGISLDDFKGWEDKKKTVFFMERKGLMGHICCVIGVPEDHARGTLHYHFLIFGGLRPYVFQNFARVHRVVEVVRSVVDSMYNSQLPEQHHLAEVSRDVVSRRVGWRIGLPVTSMRIDQPPLFRIPRPVNLIHQGCLSLGAVLEATFQQCRYQNWHHHMKTCRKGSNGRSGCRLSMPSPPISSTRPVLLVRLPLDFDVDAYVSQLERECPEQCNIFEYEEGFYRVCCELPKRDTLQYHCISPFHRGDPDRAVYWETSRPLCGGSEFCAVPDLDLHYESIDGKLSWLDKPLNRVSYRVVLDNRTVVAEWLEKKVLHRWFSSDMVSDWMSKAPDVQLVMLYKGVVDSLGNANGYIATYNPLLSLCTGAHNNVQFLGSVSQSKSAMAYLCPYLGKRKSPLLHSLVVLEEVLKHVRKYPSTAEDTGTSTRTARHVYQRLLNRLNLSIELSDYQVAAFLLNLPSIIRSCPFQYLNAKGCLDYSEYLKSGESWSFESGLSSSDVIDVEELTNGQTESECDNTRFGRKSNSVGPVKMFIIGGGDNSEKRKVLVPVADLYENRGEELAELSRIEYTAIVQVKRVYSAPKTEPRFPFKEGYLLAPYYQQSLRSKQCTVIVCSPQPRHPGEKPRQGSVSESAVKNWEKRADAFARFVLILFRPDTTSLGLGYRWIDLLDWVDCLVNSTHVLAKFRLVALHRRFAEMRNTISLAKMTSHYRRRCRDVWKRSVVEDQTEQATNREFPEFQSQEVFDQEEELHVGDVVFTNNERNKMEAVLKYDVQLGDALPSCLKEPGELCSTPTIGPVQQTSCVRLFKSIFGGSLPVSEESYEEFIDMQQTIYDGISTAEICVVSETGDDESPGGVGLMSDDERAGLLEEKIRHYTDVLNEEQCAVYRVYCERVLDTEKREVPRLALCHGPGGTGKSTLVKAIEDSYMCCGLNVVVTSFNHVNCLPFERSNTTSSMFSVCKGRGSSQPDTLSIDELTKLTTDYITKDTRLLLVEEVSNQPVNVFAKIVGVVHEQCTREHGHVVPILCVGDFGQLGPVKAVSIPKMCLALLSRRNKSDTGTETKIPFENKYESDTIKIEVEKVDSVYVKAVDVFMGAKFVELTQQMRSVDEAHTNRVVNQMYKGKRLRSADVYENYKTLSDDDYLQGDVDDGFGAEKRKGFVSMILQNSPMDFQFDEEILLDATRGFQLSDYEDLFSGFEQRLKGKEADKKVIDLEDLLYCRHFHCSPWFETPILCPTNRSRLTLSHYQALHYGRVVGQPVIRWPMQTKNWLGKPNSVFEEDLAKKGDPGFYQYFVAGCKGVFTTTVNRHNRPLKLVNASTFRLHSITMVTLESQELLNHEISRSNPGDIITLVESPKFVNVAIHEDSLSAGAVDQLDQIVSDANFGGGYHPRDAGYIVIPLSLGGHKGDDFHKIVVSGCPEGRFQSSKVSVRTPFKYDLGLTMTVNRAMGQTLPRIICAMSNHPTYSMSYSHLYVVLSRVRRGSDIRLLLNGDNPFKKRESLFYIDDRKPDPCVVAFMEGFRVGSLDVPLAEWHRKSGFDCRACIRKFEELIETNGKR